MLIDAINITEIIHGGKIITQQFFNNFKLFCLRLSTKSLFVVTVHTHKGPFTQAIFVAQFNAIFVALKLQLQNCACKPAAISVRFCILDTTQKTR